MDRLNAMAVFAAVCDANGFAGAARRLGLSPPVVTRTVTSLETHLGVRLLQRTTRSLRITEAGARYLEHVRRVMAEADAADEIARGEQVRPRGKLVVTAPLIFGRMHVADVLRRYLASHPEVTAELLLNDRNVNLIEEAVDVAIRIGALDDSSLVARRIGSTRRVVVASPAYLAARGRPAGPLELDAHDTISFGPAHAARDWLFADPQDYARELRIAIRPRLITNSGDAAIDYAREGGGLTRALHYQVAPYIATGELAVVLSGFEPLPSPIHALYPSARLLPARVRAFLDLMLEAGERAY
ncbi:LysR family transcriptional regulator [Luteimonas gilva]|uniref:LysR family transcriptional regulator n=1 Tax=Luteimonas gilva TaxID=2572684 RepID=A0A4U5JNU8_9GAMM|nr:LysR family transcriptional regulator [Luteimonas gilva]TKR30466.1 LysR family transcriptional regulator [Luteimonas gilva]